MKSFLTIIAAVLLFGSVQAHACDCLISKNWSKAQCKGKTPVPATGSTPHVTDNVSATSQSLSAAASHSQSVSNSAPTGGAASLSAVVSPTVTGGTATANSSNQGNSSASTGPSTSSANTGASSSTGSSDSQSTTYAAAHIPVATALAGFQQTTAGCRFAEGVGVQATAAGTSVGLTFKDHDCARFELAQFFYSRGQDIAGDKIICQIHEVKDALGADCLALVHEINATTPEYPPGERERRQDARGWDTVQK
jgi:hypothetical protein